MSSTVYAYPDILNGIRQCLLGIPPDFMTLPNNAEMFLFPTLKECCLEYEYRCGTDEPTASPSLAPTASPTEAPTSSPTSAPSSSPTTASPVTPVKVPAAFAESKWNPSLLPESTSSRDDELVSSTESIVDAAAENSSVSPSDSPTVSSTMTNITQVESYVVAATPVIAVSKAQRHEAPDNGTSTNQLLFLIVMAPLALLAMFVVRRKRRSQRETNEGTAPCQLEGVPPTQDEICHAVSADTGKPTTATDDCLIARPDINALQCGAEMHDAATLDDLGVGSFNSTSYGGASTFEQSGSIGDVTSESRSTATAEAAGQYSVAGQPSFAVTEGTSYEGTTAGQSEQQDDDEPNMDELEAGIVSWAMETVDNFFGGSEE